MKKNLISIVLMLAVLSTACAPGNSQPAATPTQYPTPETIAPPTAVPALVPTVSRPQPAAIDVALLANDWYWIGLTDPTQQIAIETPANYMLSFEGDGTVLIKADCNNATGSYTADNGAMTITVGPMTKAACPPGSRSDQFVKLIGNAARYSFKEGNLYIDLKADGGTLTFASLEALGGDDSAGNMPDPALTANPWQWIGLTDPTRQIAIEIPANYVLAFQPDRTVAIKADCNNATGNYTTDKGAISITVGPMTLAACPPASRSDQFIKLIGNAARYFFKDGSLYIDLKADGGTLTFASPKALSGDDSAGNGPRMTAGRPNTTSTLPADVTAQLDKWVQSLVSSDTVDPKMTAPGLVLLVDTPQGRYLSSAGVSSLEKSTPMKPDDRLEIGSNTKSFTVALIMRLQEAGLLSLDDLLSKHLPEWAPKLPNGDKITLRQMAQHTAGLWDYADDIIGGGAADPAALEKSYTPEELVQYAVDKGKPYFEPGKGWHYSNTGYILLGMIAEKLTGQTLNELYQKRIFEPLGLKTATLIEGVPQPGQITADGYWWNPDGSRVNSTNWNGSQGWAAGANAMTAVDLAAYGEGLAAGKLFKNADSLKQMLTWDDRALMSLGTPYGLGLFNVGDGYWGHGGQTLGFQSIWFTNPDEKITVVGLTNSANFTAQEFINALNILKQGHALPLPGLGLLPELTLPIDWEWVKTESPTGVEAVKPGTSVTLIKDGTATVKNGSCGTYTNGTYTVDADQRIAFKFDAPEAACTTPGDAAKLAELLTHTANWKFRDGYLAVELAADGGTLLFKVKM